MNLQVNTFSSIFIAIATIAFFVALTSANDNTHTPLASRDVSTDAGFTGKRQSLSSMPREFGPSSNTGISRISSRSHIGKRNAKSTIAVRNQLSKRDVHFIDVNGVWNIIWNQWWAFPQSPRTAAAFVDIYNQVSKAPAEKNGSALARSSSQAVDFQVGELTLSFSCQNEEVPQDLIRTFTGRMKELARAGITGLYHITILYIVAATYCTAVLGVLHQLPGTEGRLGYNMINNPIGG